MKTLFENFRKFVNEETRDTYGSEVVDRNKATFKDALVEEETEESKDSEIKKAIEDTLDDEGGAAGLDPLVKAAQKIDPDVSDDDVKQMIAGIKGVTQHKKGDYVDAEELAEVVKVFLEMKEDLLDEKKRKRKKSKKKKTKKRDACYSKVRARYKVWPSAYASGALVKCRKVGAANWGTGGKKKKKRKNESLSLKDMIREEIQNVLDEKGPSCWKGYKKNPNIPSGPGSCVQAEEIEEDLRKWFGRKGAKGSTGGWVDCNTCRKDKKSGRKVCSACGRSTAKGGAKRKRYPACRPTPSACGKKGKWGKKSKAEKKRKKG